MTSLEVTLSPAEFGVLRARDLSETVCVVFDILRATTTIITALSHGAEAVIPVGEISEALALRAKQPDVLLAGERDGWRIRAAQTGGVEFDLGNSPREFTAGCVRGRTIVSTTTNGTRALRACAHAQAVYVGSFLNLRTTAEWLRLRPPTKLILVCSGTVEEPALEDILAAGALAHALWPSYAAGHVSDGAQMARQLFLNGEKDLLGAMSLARNGRRLLAIPELRDDVACCVQRDTVPLVAQLLDDGSVREVQMG